jgi:ubiquinone biosynthesis protein
LALGLTAAASIVAAGLTAVSTILADWVPATFGVVGGLLTFGLERILIR